MHMAAEMGVDAAAFEGREGTSGDIAVYRRGGDGRSCEEDIPCTREESAYWGGL